MKLNFEELKAKAEENRRQQEKDFAEGIQRQTTNRKNEAMQAVFSRMAQTLDDRHRAQMEADIKEKTAAVESEIRAQYEKEHPSDWNQSDTRKAFKDLVKEIRISEE